ncbi:TnsA endonuclease N-terminal domain-containing protein [Acidovorax sp. NPDC077693]|uniref:TnsA endonuclease N-terminal domain-containing protein n=1 Tax=unclassified Acidovorax TaxID=2684926 RepID=UPI0037C987E1
MQIPSSVRRIPISTVSITGRLDGQMFESALERDLLMQLAWSENVEWFVTQPVEIRYEFPVGKKRVYTPDVLFGFSDETSSPVEAVLCEVKYREDLAKNWQELRQKFRAARRYCAERGWRFVIFDETRIRDVQLKNIQFLWNYRGQSVPPELELKLLQQFAALGDATMSKVVEQVAATQTNKANVIWAWWCLVAQKRVLFDEDQPLNGNTIFFLPATHE